MNAPLEHLQQLIILLQGYRSDDAKAACPWTKAQTLASLLPQTIEEVYEFAETIEQHDNAGFKDELSDLLYHVLFYAQIAKEQQLFTLDDVAKHSLEKHLRRMPKHEQRQELEPLQIDAHWQKLKQQERAGKPSILSDVAITIPALTRSVKLQNRGSQAGFDWQEVAQVLEKVQEELQELTDELKDLPQPERVLHELGDVLFSCCALARHLHIDPEQALRTANRRFTERFQHMEAQLRTRKQKFADLTFDEMEKLWQNAKSELD